MPSLYIHASRNLKFRDQVEAIVVAEGREGKREIHDVGMGDGEQSSVV